MAPPLNLDPSRKTPDMDVTQLTADSQFGTLALMRAIDLQSPEDP